LGWYSRKKNPACRPGLLNKEKLLQIYKEKDLYDASLLSTSQQKY
jgi:hypothetical protein